MEKKRWVEATPVPDGLKDFSKVFEELKWLHETRLMAERIPSSKMKDSLLEDLSKRMDDPDYLPRDTLVQQLEKAANTYSDLEARFRDVQSTLAEIEDDLIMDHSRLPNLYQSLLHKHFCAVQKCRVFFSVLGFLSGFLSVLILQHILS
jgi:hypothetical protein